MPGGDPMAAALAAGETPSPEMVAAAGGRGGVEPSRARGLLIALAAALALAIFLTPRANIAWFVGVEKSPEVLRERAREILQGFGLPKPADSASVFLTDGDFLDWVSKHGGFGSDMSRDAIAFGYRQAARPLAPEDAQNGPFPMPRVTELDPPPVQAGMAEVLIDPRGRLVRLSIVPPELEKETALPPDTDWATLFRQAGLDIARFKPVEPRWTPRSFADVRAAWEGPHPERPDVTMRVEAASFRGRPVSFRWIGPWSQPTRDPEGSLEAPAGGIVFEAILLVIVFGSTVLARRNVKAGRSDRRGAIRIAAVIILLQTAMWVLGAHHVASADEGWMFINALCNTVGMGLCFWTLYLALEPFARRIWPEMLISWTRAISGEWRDPLVGRDVLIGAAVGIASGLIMGPLRVLLPLRLGLPGPPPAPLRRSGSGEPGARRGLGSLGRRAVRVLGLRHRFSSHLRPPPRSPRVARRSARHAALQRDLSGLTRSRRDASLALISVGILVAMTVRFGILPAIVVETCRRIFGYKIYSSDPSSWTFYAGMLAVGAVLALAWWAAKTALAGRSLFGSWGLEEKAVAGK